MTSRNIEGYFSRRKLTRIFLPLCLGLLSLAPQAREFKLVEDRTDYALFVDIDQLKVSTESKGAYLVTVKFLQHWKRPRDYGLKNSVGAEEKLLLAYCSAQGGNYQLMEHRFLSPIDLITSGKAEPVLKTVSEERLEQIVPGSPEAAAIRWSCTWVSANRK